MGHPSGPNSGGTNRDLGIPGDHLGGPGEVHETKGERIIHDAVMERLCRYCETKYIAKKDDQRFHDTRCKLEYVGGKIHDATFDRWKLRLREMQRWYEGGEDKYNTPEFMRGQDFNPGEYVREQDYMLFDHARGKLYLIITEIQKRADRSRAIDSSKAWKMLAEAMLALFAMPKDFSLDAMNDWYFSDATQTLGNDLGYDTQSKLPVTGLKGWEIIRRTIEKRYLVDTPNYRWERNWDKRWLDI